MPDEALKATERQYVSLLSAASPGIQVQLSLYTLPGISRSEASQRHIASIYSSIDDMWNGQLDGLIVTGREPLAADLKDEPYWDSFTRTVQWAYENAYATVWSCLAAHAAVLQMDGIPRVKRNDKLFGIFPCTRIVDHPLMAQTPAQLELPHSRWNSLPMKQLVESGYTVLTHTSEMEVDTFVKQEKKLFVFFQGHPEYDADTLLREYRRDVGRHCKGETPLFPSAPSNYFDADTTHALSVLWQRASPSERNGLSSEISAVLENSFIRNTWMAGSARVYRNWLFHICRQKAELSRSKARKPTPCLVP
jgi:homoserine O-succinyltransferase